jgi:membrane protein
MAARPTAADVLKRLPAGPVLLARAWLERLVAVQLVDRAVALAGRAFTALIPLFIVYDTVVPQVNGRNFAEDVIDRFDLKGAAADSVRQALAPSGDVQQTLSVLGVLLVIVSALSFARALQRLYEVAFGLEPLGGVRGTPSTLLWLALLPGFITAREVIGAIFPGVVGTVLSLTLAATLWTLTPFILLGRRLEWRRLVPTGLITAAAMSLLGVASLIWMPHTVAESAQLYGVIGVAFALLSWLVAAGFVLVGCAAAGAVAGERRLRAA